MRYLVLALCASLLVTSCKKADPNSVPDQLELLANGKTPKDQLKAAENLASIVTPETAVAVAQALKDAPPAAKAKIAPAIGKLKIAATVAPLAAALDLEAPSGADEVSEAISNANKEIANALGDIGGKEAVQALVNLLKATKNNYVRLAAIGGLGKLKDVAAVPVLSNIATDERLEPFIGKSAILALAEINDPGALPAYLKMLFAERQGISFYPESSYGIFLLGDAANDKILTVLKGEDQELLKWAEQRKVIIPAIIAKAAQIETDLQDPRAVEPLLKILKYDDAKLTYKLFVRVAAADSLGRMRAKAAVKPLMEMLTEEEANARGAYARALVQIGDPAALPKLVACAKNGNWSSREPCMNALAMLGGAKEAKEFDGFIKAEGNNFTKECGAGLYGELDCVKEKDSNVAKRTATMEKYKNAIVAVAACADNKCVEKLLDNADMVMRERAAYELGRRGAVESLPALMATVRREIKDIPELNPRFASVCAIDWITTAHPESKASLKKDVAELGPQVEADSKKVLTQKVAEEVRRLLVKLKRT